MPWEFDRVSMALEIPTGGFNFDWNKVYPKSCLMCSSCFSAGFFPGVSPPESPLGGACPALRDCSCQIVAKANENIGLI